MHNLEERVKIEELEETLREIFSEFGNIIDIVAKKNLRARGQAFVVFEDVDSATSAIDEIQGFEIYNKPMALEYARTRSDATVKAEGDEEEFEEHKRQRLAAKEARKAEDVEQRLKLPISAAAAPQEQKKLKPLKSTNTGFGIVPDAYLPPNKTLVLQDVPEDAFNVKTLTAIFERFPGFAEVRVPPIHIKVAFVEYENDATSTVAKDGTNGMRLGVTNTPIRVSYQRG